LINDFVHEDVYLVFPKPFCKESKIQESEVFFLRKESEVDDLQI